MDSQGFREAAATAIDDIASYYDNLDDRDVVSTVEPGYLRKLLPSEAPVEGEAWTDIHKDMEGKILPGITHWQHPGFHAFFPCATSYPSLLGELYSAALPAAAFNWICSPAVTELETIVLDWLAKVLGLPECYLSTGPTRGGGVIQGSASEAVLVAMVAARDKYLRETVPLDQFPEGSEAREDAIAHKRSKMVALATSATHSSTKKASIISAVRFHTIPVHADTGYSLTGPVLAKTLAELRARGLEPFFMTATLGTTDTCAVDDFAGIVSTLKSDPVHPAGTPGELWVHIDAAYAGSALVLPSVQEQVTISLIENFHSFNMNMHKWLLTNFDASCLFVRDRNWFIQALTINQAVYGNKASEGGLVTDYREWMIPLGRRFRSLKIWFVLRSYGVKGLQEYISRTLKLGEEFADSLKSRPDLFEILTGPSFTLTVFRVAGKEQGKSEEELNALTKAVCEKINASGRMWVTSTVLDGMFAIRLMTGVSTTEKEHVDRSWKILVEAAEEVLKA
ncbi:pyridoxal phosphate-dependent transferase [Neurospora tetraspora]|uniref:Pyridoxal phosphate-dependent transferase n=1 Tax=Neurospora tetraspora TaxID=94610 RepID=A0AAE0J9B0_9PEZI|nr:pyridoxal phosphate-dependent transferase [Neurospora tetraspora]